MPSADGKHKNDMYGDVDGAPQARETRPATPAASSDPNGSAARRITRSPRQSSSANSSSTTTTPT